MKSVQENDSSMQKRPEKRGKTKGSRVGNDGNMTLQKTMKDISLVSSKLRELQTRLSRATKKIPANKQFLRVETNGFSREPQVKLLDKISFVLGVNTIVLTEYILLKRPEWLPAFYQTLMLTMILMRTYFYFTNKAQFFLMDFCYAVNLSCMLQTRYQPDNLHWFKVNYLCAMGPLCAAIPLWRNSLVFHSLDKLTSFFLHGFPALVFLLFRFRHIHSPVGEDKELEITSVLPSMLIVYVLWQLAYSFVTEVVFKQDFDNDRNLITSLRFLANNRRSPMRIFLAKFLTMIGVLQSQESLDPDDTKTKLLFVAVQFVYTFSTVLPCLWLYTNEDLNIGYICFIFLIGSWNGASYYIEVFSRNYNQQFEAGNQVQGNISKTTNKSTEKDIETALEDLRASNEMALEIAKNLEDMMSETNPKKQKKES